MPMHNWAIVPPGIYHNFHLQWIAAMAKQLNSGLLPSGCFAMAEQVTGGQEPDVVALKSFGLPKESISQTTLVLAEPRLMPSTSVVMKAEIDRYVQKSNRIVVRHVSGDVLAIIELVSPGNKSSVHAIRSMVDKLVEFFYDGINLLIVDPFPPGPRDPDGIHALIWQQINDTPFRISADRPLTIASYQASPTKTAWVEPTAIGMPLPVMPLFLQGSSYINLPLEESYQETWTALPKELKGMIYPHA